MKLECDIFGAIAFFAAAHSIIIAIFLISRTESKGKASFFLGLSQISGAMVLASSLITTTNIFKLFPKLIGISYPFIFLSGFFTLYYIHSLMENPVIYNRRMRLFSIGPITGIVLSFPFFIINDAARADYLSYINVNHNYPAYDWMIWLLGLIYNWIILAAALLRIRKHRNELVITLLSFFSFNRWLVDFSINMSALFPAFILIIFSYTYLLNLVNTVRVKSPSNPLKEKLPQKQLIEMYAIIKQEMEMNKHLYSI